LVLRVTPGVRPQLLLEEVGATRLTSFEALSVVTARGGAALEATYRIGLRDESAADDLVDALNRLEGVQGVELRRTD
jgi:hypothetical protein